MTTKEKVLETLNRNKCDSVSGELLAEKCNVSRAAVWKAVKSLREQGYNITGTTNGGYILESDNDVVSNQQFYTYLKKNHQEFQNIHVECFKDIDSTNTYAKKVLSECGNLRSLSGELTESGKEYHQAAIIAEHQTAGRGRLGRTFISPVKSGIYLTIIYAPQGGIQQPAKLTALSAVAVIRAIKNVYGLETQIKWINDIFYKGKKVGGILTEGFTNFETGIIESAIIGIGINIEVNNEISVELKDKAGSLFSQDEKKSAGRCELAAEITAQCLKIFNEDEIKSFEEYKKHSFILGKEITVYPLIGDEKSSFKATAIDVDSEAGLVVRLEDGSKKTLNSGEVTLKSVNLAK